MDLHEPQLDGTQRQTLRLWPETGKILGLSRGATFPAAKRPNPYDPYWTPAARAQGCPRKDVGGQVIMPEQTIAEALPYVQMAAARLIHRVASTDYDQDDLRQDLTVILLKRISKFDPARASLARFVWVLADHHVANVRSHRRAQRRDHRRAEPFWENNSLNAREFEGNDLTSIDQYESAFGRYSRTATEVIELRLDVARVMSTLPPELKAVASILQAGSIKTTARAVGASRATVYRKSRGVLRAAFMKAGLDRYAGRVTVAPRRKAA